MRLLPARGAGWLDAALQGAAALLEGELPDGRRAGADRAAVPARSSRTCSRRTCRCSTGACRYTAFLVPGLVMMAVLQNAFANSSSSLIQSKITGNLIFVLLPPLSPLRDLRRLRAGRDGARPGGRPGRVRRHAVVRADLRAARIRSGRSPSRCSAARILGILGLIAGIWADKFDQLAAFQNFVIMPLTFLSGVFYSIHSLPPFWQALSHFNPFFYMIDGFRYGFFGVSDVAPGASLAIVALASARHCRAVTLRAAASAATNCGTEGDMAWSPRKRSSARSSRPRLRARRGRRRRPAFPGADRQSRPSPA